MKAQLMLEMTFMLLVSASFVILVAAMFACMGNSYASGTDSIGAYYARSANAVAQGISPYSEFHIITAGS